MFPLSSRSLIRGCVAHQQAGLGCAADYIADYVPLRAPVNGRTTLFVEPSGGDWVGLIGEDGRVYEFAHLSEREPAKQKVYAGESLGKTGNSGAVTTGPHLHLQVKMGQNRVDPESLDWRTHIPITIVGIWDAGLTSQLIAYVEQYSRGDMTVDVTHHLVNLPYDPSHNWEELASHYEGRFVVFSCYPASDIYKTFVSGDRKQAIAVCGQDTKTVSFEVSHLLTKFYNANRGTRPQVPNEDVLTPPEDMRYRKYEVIKPQLGYLLTVVPPNPPPIAMTKEEWLIRSFQALEGYKDPGGVAYWSQEVKNKGINAVYAYLSARLEDKKDEIESVGPQP